MQKKGLIIFSLILLASFIFMFGVIAQTDAELFQENFDLSAGEAALDEQTTAVDSETSVVTTEDETGIENIIGEEKFSEFSDAQLETEPGITPDSGAYFIEDKILSNFRDPSANMDKRVAGMQQMIKEGKIDEARESFEGYQKYANKFEDNFNPANRDKELRGAVGRTNAIKNIQEKMPDKTQAEFVTEVLESEKKVVTAIEIADKISELCSQLSKLDPSQYSKVCSTGEDDSDWRRNFDKKLTEEQRQEALKFGEIMSQCFETSGQDCACEEIAYPDFAEACSVAAPLATACEIENNKEACEKLDNLEMPTDNLPDYLQDIFERIESGMNEDKYGMFLPPECEEANAKTPKECAKIMINVHAPEECRQALIDADVQNEREGRQICEKIMFEQNAPSECVEAGVSNPQDCGKFMFSSNAPPECIEAGLDGSDRNDPADCRELMESKFSGGPGGFGANNGQCPPGENPGINDQGQQSCLKGGTYAQGTRPNMQRSGSNCKDIQDLQEKVNCYEGATQYVVEYQRDFKENFNQIDRPAFNENNFQDYQNENPEMFRQEFDNQQRYDDFKDGKMMSPPEGYQNYQQPPEGYQQSGTFNPQQGFGGEPTITEGTTGFNPENTAPTSSSETTTSGTTESAPVTGGVISDSRFLRWFWG
ncbi:MAG: hypothetical protein Q8O84_04450 [Nanoarchaeota archaeon]|nr:hypothetical protein [Nanoarchaeota archaeon]